MANYSALFVLPYDGPLPTYEEYDGTLSVDVEQIAYINTHSIARLIVKYCHEIRNQGGDWEYDGVMGMIWQDVRKLSGQDPSPDHRFTDRGLVGTAPVGDDQRQARKPISNRKAYVVLARNNFQCVRCGSGDDLEIDHIHPVSRGGSNQLDNLQTLCHDCNMRKGARLPDEMGEDW